MAKFTTTLFTIISLLLLSPTILSSASPLTSSPKQHVFHPNHDETSTIGVFRDLQHRDLPAITTILVDAFLPSAMWTYIFPNATAHKREIWTCYHDTIEAQWPYNHTKTAAKVIAVPHYDEATGHDTDVAVAFAVWNIISPHDNDDDEEGTEKRENHSSFSSRIPPFFPNFLSSQTPKSCPHGLPPSTNLTRALATNTQLSAIDAKFFSSATYPRGQLYLNLLATHPDWDGHGFAAKHVEWGMELARNELKLPVTLLSSPAGFHVYDGEGFRSVSNVTVEKLDGEEGLWFEVMDWEREREE